MMRPKTGCVLLAALSLALTVQTACTRDTGWEKANNAGMKALQEGRYAEAEQHLAAALKEAEKFGKQDPRLATSLNNLALLYDAQGQYAHSTSARWRSCRRRWGRSIPTWPRASTTWRGFTTPKATTPRPSRSIGGRSPS